MFKRLMLLSSISVALSLLQAQDVAGDWVGTFARPGSDLRIALHIGKPGSGFKATLDSVDQGISGIPLDAVQIVDSRLTFHLIALQASYDGKLNPAATAIEGALTGGWGSSPLNFHRGTIPRVEHKAAKPSDIDGDWTGTLEGQAYLFHIANTEDGLIVMMDVPDQHIKGAPSSIVTRSDSSIAMEWKVFGSRFDAKISEDRNTIEGTVTQAAASLPMTLKRTARIHVN
jgi:hypothetical protein